MGPRRARNNNNNNNNERERERETLSRERSYRPAGDAVDRRAALPFDVVQLISYKGVLVEVRFSLAPLKALAALAAPAYALSRVPTESSSSGLQEIRTHLFEFPTAHLEHATRADVRCLLDV